MKPNTEKTANDPKPENLARVRVLKNRLRIGSRYHAVGSETVITAAEYEIRKKDGEVELIDLV